MGDRALGLEILLGVLVAPLDGVQRRFAPIGLFHYIHQPCLIGG